LIVSGIVIHFSLGGVLVGFVVVLVSGFILPLGWHVEFFSLMWAWSH
jgi:hypothetical protein